MTQIYFGVDGTGPATDDKKTYKKQFKNSFVNVFQKFSWDYAGYRRGPTMEGLLTETLGVAAAIHVQRFVRIALALSGVAPFVCLAGYSRGGAAVIHACNLLKQQDISVDCLLLFDAVDRAGNLSGVEVVPSNVARVYHARRHDDAGSRPYFGSCGTSLAKGADGASLYSEKFFYGTHGALGGVPHEKEKAPVVSLKPVIPDPRFAVLELAMRSMVYFHQSNALSKDQILESEVLPTNVTYEQEQAAAKAVGAWMRGNLNAARTAWQFNNGLRPPTPTPGRAHV